MKLGDLGNLGDIMQQAKDMQEQIQQAQDKIASMEIMGESGAGMIKVVMTGRYDVKKLTIDPSLLSENKEILEDLIAAAVNDAVRKIEQNSQEQMAKLTGGLQMPPGFKMPF